MTERLSIQKRLLRNESFQIAFGPKLMYVSILRKFEDPSDTDSHYWGYQNSLNFVTPPIHHLVFYLGFFCLASNLIWLIITDYIMSTRMRSDYRATRTTVRYGDCILLVKPTRLVILHWLRPYIWTSYTNKHINLWWIATTTSQWNFFAYVYM